MSIFIRKTTKDGTYDYDFQFKGDRFQGNTGKTRKREAEEIERGLKDEARRAWEARKTINSPDASMTVGQACTRYWQDKSQDIVKAEKGLAWSLGWIERYFGIDARLVDIGDNEITRMVAARRGEPNQNFDDPRPLSKATVNRSATVPMRQLMNRAAKVWKVPVQVIDWRQHLLGEPQERIREARIEEELAIFDKLGRGYDAAVEFAIATGARRQEIIDLTWGDIDWINRRLKVTGKRDRTRTIPITDDVFALLKGELGHHPVKVFTFVSEYTRVTADGRRYERGQRYPMTATGLEAAFKRMTAKAGVSNYRFHDNRHTAATRLLRETGNLKLVQRLLGHSDIGTTAKYAHVTDDDLAQAMAAVSRKKSRRDETVAKSPAKSPANSGTAAVND